MPEPDARPQPGPAPRAARLWAWGSVFLVAAGVADALFNYALVRALDIPSGFWFVATATVPSWALLAALLPVVFAAADRFPFHDRPTLRTALVHLPIALGVAVLHIALAVIVSDVLLSERWTQGGFVRVLGRGMSNYLVFDMLIYAGIVGLYYAVEYQRRYREQTEAAARLQVELERAELQMLRSQLDPHFLFNALNAISGTALRRDPERTAGLISDLSQLLRRSLRTVEPEVSLEEELEFLEAYLSIERARMGGRLEVHIDVPRELLGRRVPSLLLQPLVENAVRHGLAEEPGGGRIGVTVRERAGRTRIEVWDDGAGFPAAADGAEGVGLSNTRARLKELYGDAGKLVLSNREEGGARIVVEIPAGPGGSRAVREEVGWRVS